jgi:hypothetical protein
MTNRRSSRTTSTGRGRTSGRSAGLILCCPMPSYAPDGTVGMVWTKHATGDPLPCRICRRKAICRDCQNRPCHKVCAERELQQTARR